MAKVKTGPKVKRKGGGIPAKAKKVDALAAEISGAKAVVVTEYRGLKVAELQDLRRRLRPKGVEYHVVKNSLFGRAATKSGSSGIDTLLAGPTAVALGNIDEVELAKSIVDELRGLKALKIVGAYVSGTTYSAEEVQSLAKLPNRKVLEGMLVGTITAPLGNIVSIMTAAQGNLIRVLQARA